MDFNYFDLAIIAILSIFATRGGFRGFISEIFSLMGIVGSIWAAYNYYSLITPYLDFLQSSIWRNIAAYALVFFLGILLTSILIYFIKKILSFSFLPWVDKLLGFCFGLCKGLLVSAIIVTIAQGFFNNTEVIKGAMTTPYLNMLMEYVQSHMPPDIFTIT